MLKYFCLILFVSAVYTAPVDDHKVPNHHEHDVDTEVVEDVNVVNHVSSHPTHVPTHSVHDHDDETVEKARPKHVEILESDNVHETDGSYSFHYRGEDGSFREETAVVKNPGTDKQYLEVNGAYSFLDTDGKEVVVHYKADDRGFVPVGTNIPDAISLAAQLNSQNPSIHEMVDSEEDDDVVLKNKSDDVVKH